MLRRITRRLLPGSERGFTLVEMLFGMLLLSVVFAAWSGLLSVTVRNGGNTQESSNLQTELRAAVDTLAADLRQAYCDPTTNPATLPVTTASPTAITFYSPSRTTVQYDPDGGGPLAPIASYPLRQISYQLTGAVPNAHLDRRFATSTNTSGSAPPWTWGSFTAWTQILGSVTSASAFTYRDGDGAVTTNAAAVASVDVSLTIRPKASRVSATYQTTVDVRAAGCA